MEENSKNCMEMKPASFKYFNDEDEESVEEEEIEHAEFDADIEECILNKELTKVEEVIPPPKKQEDDLDKILLEPDHPLLVKFQQTLKDQLERQRLRLKNEVNELEISIKKKSADRLSIGERVYDAQQLISMQQQTIEQIENEIAKISTERNEIEVELETIKATHKEKHDMLIAAERKEIELRNEIETINFLLQKMIEWQNKLESDMAVNKRITDKTKLDQKQYMEEMRNLDFIIYKLMTEVFRLESSLDHLNMQLRVKEEERESLATKISDANADIEALEQEHKRLIHSWNCVLVAIGHRDKLYYSAQKDLEKEQENFQGTITEITGYKRLSRQEMEKNEQLTLFKGRIDMDKTNVIARLQYEHDRITNLERKLMNIHAMITQINNDQEQVLLEKKMDQQFIADLDTKLYRQNSIKSEIQEKILQMLQDQISNDKVSKYMNKSIRIIREKNRNLEIQLALIENKNADILVAIEQQRVTNEEAVRLLNDTIKAEKACEKELNDAKSELNAIAFQCSKNMKEYDLAIKQYDELMEQTGGVELTPLEIKIKTLERRIAELDEKNNKLKSLWLREQLYIVSLKKERSTQIYEINIIRKQSMLLQQRNLKLEDELEELAYQARKHERSMNTMKSKIDKYNNDLWKKRGLKDFLDLNTVSFKLEYVNRLKEAELDCIKLEAKIAEMEEEKETLSREIVESNRDMLAWEKKVKLAQETKSTIVKERGAAGEVGSMKAEIHRMTVRYSQLRRAQDKLVHDLNHCISRREFIFVNAEATEKRLALTGTVNNRTNFMKKLENVKVKLKKAEKEKKDTEKNLKKGIFLEEDFEIEIKECDSTINDMKTKIIELINSIEAAKFDRQKELELLVFKQHKLRAFTSISKGQYRAKFRTEEALDQEFTHQMQINRNLQHVIENLILAFPNLYPEFAKILNTLKVIHKT